MQVVGIIALISQDGAGLQAVNEFVRTGDVIFLAWASDQPDWIAKCVAGGMDFGAQTTPGATKALGMRPPFTWRAPAAC